MNDGMHRFAAVLTAGLGACLVAGCGASHIRFTGAHAFITPAWLAKTVHREATLLSARDLHGIEITFGKQRDVVEIFGDFRTPAPTCTTSYCPVPIGLHATSVRLVIATRTHRVLSVNLGQRITHAQAPGIARHSSPFLRIFRSVPGRIACSIPRGGMGSVHLRGRCTTEFVSAPPYRRREIRIGFIERWREGHRVDHGGWIVTVGLDDGRVLGVHLTGGVPPQLWM